uniref:ATP phosphoribosyltransferase n=1 Tax=Ignisphaera aggregans TaxID=334771 RepID=A0A7C2ZMG5_9CREN
MRIAIPNKGRLKDPALQLLRAIGIKTNSTDERALIIPTNWKNVELVAVRTEDIPYIVESGGADLGITGRDYVVESRADVEELLRLDFGEGLIVFAVPKAWGVRDVQELRDREIRIATKYPNIVSDYIKEKGLKAKIVRVSGATEVMPYLGAADAVVDVVNSGTTLKIHGLEPVDTILSTYAVLIANRRWRSKALADKVQLIVTLIQGVINAKNKKMLFMNVPSDKLDDVLSVLPAMLAPAITKLSSANAWEVITVVEEELLPTVLNKALEKGARDIVVIDIEKVVK